MDFVTNAITTILAAPFIILGWIIVGAIAGDLARRVMNRPNRGCLSDFILGIGGALVGGILAGLFGIDTADGGLVAVITSLVLATIGAVVLVGLSGVFTRNRKS